MSNTNEQSQEVKHQVLGFCLTQFGTILILKSRPAWIAGKWNGVGGKIEPGESVVDAMVREFCEETGLVAEAHQWRELLTLRGKAMGRMTVFMAYMSLDGAFLPYETDEGIAQLVDGIPEPMDGTAAWLLPMCWDLHHTGMQLEK